MDTERVNKTRFHFAHLMSRKPCKVIINYNNYAYYVVRVSAHLHNKLASVGTLQEENEENYTYQTST